MSRLRGGPHRSARELLRLLAATAVVLGCAGGVIGVGGRQAFADPIQSCSSSAGVLVAVNFGHWGGPVELGCGPDSGTGYDAMTAAGFITAGTQSDGPAFICRIGLASQGTQSFRPTPSEDPCVNTPPLSASWSYWHADAGQSTWSYSPTGAMSYRPPAGSVDAWTFGATSPSGTTGQPPFSPEQVRAAAQSGGSAAFVPASPAPPTTAAPATAPGPAPAPSPTTPPAGGSPPSTSVTAAASGTSIPTSGTSRPAPTPAVTATAPAHAPTTTTATTRPEQTTAGTGGAGAGGTRGGASSSASTGGFRIVASSAGSAGRRGSSGPPAASIAGLAVVAGLTGTAGAVAWRRRRAG